MTAYYNEIDPFAAAWLRELVKAGHIADGVVDERSIEDVTPNDLREFTQCHFFAGIGVWSYALRRAGWPDDRPIWTGSCPCQPFSAAGKGGGFDDERHLWPAWDWLIEQCDPAVIVGEQVASKDAEPWLDLVQADLESMGYAFGAVAFPSAGIGAPHIRDRTYWAAHADDARSQGWSVGGHGTAERLAGQSGLAGGLAEPDHPERRSDAAGRHDGDGQDTGRPQGTGDAEGRGVAGGLARDDQGERRPRRDGAEPSGGAHLEPAGRGAAGGLADGTRDGRREECAHAGGQPVGDRAEGLAAGFGASGGNSWTGPTNGLWRDADWLLCRDGKWRPVEPGTFPLAHGAPARVGRLRGYGNAINAQAAEAFIRSYLEGVA